MGYLAEIMPFPRTAPVPKNWASCSGQLLPISQNTALFSVLGTRFGGDGKSTFALPNLPLMTTAGGPPVQMLICMFGMFPQHE